MIDTIKKQEDRMSCADRQIKYKEERYQELEKELNTLKQELFARETKTAMTKDEMLERIKVILESMGELHAEIFTLRAHYGSQMLNFYKAGENYSGTIFEHKGKRYRATLFGVTPLSTVPSFKFDKHDIVSTNDLSFCPDIVENIHKFITMDSVVDSILNRDQE